MGALASTVQKTMAAQVTSAIYSRGLFDPVKLFRNAEEGTFLDFNPSQVYSDTAGTDPAEVGEGIAFIDDKSPNDVDATQATSTARPILRQTGNVYHAEFDLTDDILPITLPAITGGTVALVGLSGIWIEDNWDYAGGTLNIGPTTIAGLPAGILSVVGDLCAVIINDRAWTAAERAGVIAWGKSRGAPGVFSVSDTELVTNGTFDADVSGWTPGPNGTLTWESGRALSTVTAGSQGVNAANTFNLADGEIYIASAEYEAVTGNTVLLQFRTGVFLTGTNVASFIFLVSYNGRQRGVARIGSNYPTAYLNAGLLGNPYPGAVYLDNISVRKLELLP